MTRQEFLARAADHVLLLDGATGSNLRKAGMPVRLCMPLLLEQTESVL